MPHCTCCFHPQRLELDAALVRGEGHRPVAAQFKVSKAAVTRHLAHIQKQVQRTAVRTEAKLARSLESVLAECHAGVARVLAMAEEEGDGDLALKAWREKRGLAELEFGTKSTAKVETTVKAPLPATEAEELAELKVLEAQLAARREELEAKGAMQ